MSSSRRNRKTVGLKKRGGWKYSIKGRNKKASRHSKILSIPRDGSLRVVGGKCGCAASKFFSGGDSNVADAKNVIPMADYSNDPQRLMTIGNLPQTGGRRKTMRIIRSMHSKGGKCQTCGKKIKGGFFSLYGSPNAVSSFGVSPDMNGVTNSIFSTQSLTNPMVYSQDSLKQSTIV